MHQACRLVLLVAESKGITTVPRSRPPGLIILYASRTNVLILSADCTVTIRSEYISTASVFRHAPERRHSPARASTRAHPLPPSAPASPTHMRTASQTTSRPYA